MQFKGGEPNLSRCVRGGEVYALSSTVIHGECPPRTQSSDPRSPCNSSSCSKFAAMPRVRSFVWVFCEVVFSEIGFVVGTSDLGWGW